MHSTHLRHQLTKGLMVGTAIGEALGLARTGLCRRVALKMFGRPQLKYRFLPGRGIYSDDTRLMLMAAQSILQCRSDLRSFRRKFQSRLSWYPLSLPIGIDRSTWLACKKAWLYRTGITTGVRSTGNGATTRAMFIALAINGNGHRLRKWVEESTKTTHTHPQAIEGCQVLAQLADTCATTSHGKIEPLDVLNNLIAGCEEASLKEGLQRLVPFLEKKRSPSSVARHFGWHRGIRGHIFPSTIMATYCCLRYPTNFNRAVKSAIGLGGDSESLGAIVGGLVGAHIGFDRIPQPLVKSLGGYPQGLGWIEEMSNRLSHWPHGMHDLSFAPPLPSDPMMQLLRSLFSIGLAMFHFVFRLPYKFFTRSKPLRMRR
jgi:ADP-ribosylglycohydrolase